MVRYDGSRWREVAMPAGTRGITSVAAVSADDVWAVADRNDSAPDRDGVLLPWDGGPTGINIEDMAAADGRTWVVGTTPDDWDDEGMVFSR